MRWMAASMNVHTRLSIKFPALNGKKRFQKLRHIDLNHEANHGKLSADGIKLRI